MTYDQLHTGDASTLGASVHKEGVNFALFSDHAEAVELCLFDPSSGEEIHRLSMHACKDGIWAGFLVGAAAGLVYGYRVHGANAPHLGHRFNPHKLLLDPYAKELAAPFIWSDRHFSYQRAGDQVIESALDCRDNADVMAKGLVVPDSVIDTGIAPNVPWSNTVFYETHVKGFSREKLDLSPSERGTFDGLKADASLEYLKALGITTIELLPIHALISEHHLHRLGLVNYWGYNSLSYFAPHPGYLGEAGSDSIRGFVRAAHDMGLEVALDVVYNHTCEGNHLGPVTGFRGIDNKSYYRLSKADQRHYQDETGCGNTLNTGHPVVDRLIVDSLKHWRTSYGIDGFRFDLAPVLGSENGAFDAGANLVKMITDDAVLNNAKLIAEPWSAVGEGYSLGKFPPGWAEWNDKARDTFRGFWHRGGGVRLAEFAQRISGSADVFEDQDRGPIASVNLVACHDGFTLADATQYQNKHNWANGEANRDGHNHNVCDNFGHEGPSPDLAVRMLRARRRRSLLGTVFMAAGVPLMLGGDEFGRSQMGNNNAYNQDNSVNWLDWSLSGVGDGRDLLAFTRYVIGLRGRLRHFDREDYLPPIDEGASESGMTWLMPNGASLTETQWHDRAERAIGKLVWERDTSTSATIGGLYFVFNANEKPIDFKLPEVSGNLPWAVVLDSGRPIQPVEAHGRLVGEMVQIETGAMAVFAAGDVWKST